MAKQNKIRRGAFFPKEMSRFVSSVAQLFKTTQGSLKDRGILLPATATGLLNRLLVIDPV